MLLQNLETGLETGNFHGSLQFLIVLLFCIFLFLALIALLIYYVKKK